MPRILVFSVKAFVPEQRTRPGMRGGHAGARVLGSVATFRLDRRLIGFPHNAHGEGVQMSEKSYLDKLVGAWHTNLEADDYDEGVADELISEIRKVSPEAYEKIKEESGYNRIIG